MVAIRSPRSSGSKIHAYCQTCLSVYHTHMNSADLIKLMEKAGWTLRSVKGSHHVFRHPTIPGHVTVPHPKKDLGIGITNKLLKQTGLK